MEPTRPKHLASPTWNSNCPLAGPPEEEEEEEEKEEEEEEASDSSATPIITGEISTPRT